MQKITRRTFLWNVTIAAGSVMLLGCASASPPPPLDTPDPSFVPQTKTLTLAEGQSLSVTVTDFSVAMDRRAVVTLILENTLGREILLSDSAGDRVLTLAARVDGSPAQILPAGLLGQTILDGEVKEGIVGFPLPPSFDGVELEFSLQAEGQTQRVQFEL